MFEEIPALTILPFFNLKTDIFYAKKATDVSSSRFLLPSTCDFLSEKEFCKVYMGYNNHAIYLHLRISKPYENKDSFELFFDTRDVKDKSFVSQFCHHFIFFADDTDFFSGKEITRFRTEEVHSLCSPKDLKATPHFSKKSYILDIEIKSSALFGYDPSSFDSMGFTYRINQKEGLSQHFAISSLEYKIESQPSLWASFKFCK